VLPRRGAFGFLARAALLACAAVAWLALPAATARAGELTVVDQLSPDQVTEDIHLTIDGEQVGGFALGPGHAVDVLRVHVTDAPHHEYVLCGETTLRTASGEEQTVPVNDSGMLDDADGRIYAAYTAAYRSFFLRDVTPGRPPAQIQIHLGPRCPAAISQSIPENAPPSPPV